eukprot:362607-Chlamydomonas_euryale.AAC.29
MGWQRDGRVDTDVPNMHSSTFLQHYTHIIPHKPLHTCACASSASYRHHSRPGVRGRSSGWIVNSTPCTLWITPWKPASPGPDKSAADSSRPCDRGCGAALGCSESRPGSRPCRGWTGQPPTPCGLAMEGVGRR